jgi:hypothetical protein
MSRGMRLTVGVVLALASTLVLAALTRVPYTAEPGDTAELRLTWRARAAPEQECRRLTAAEQESLPVHMRRAEVCEGRVASYRLEVIVDGEVRRRSTVRGAGARGDRPLYVYDAIRLAPGRHEVHVRFERIGAEGGEAAGDGEARTGGVPDRLELSARLDLGPREVALVTYDATGRRLVLRPPPVGR